MAFQASGVSGSIRYGYHVVARLSQWTLDAQEQVRASSSAVHEFYRDEPGPFTLRLDVGSSEWVWPDVQVLEWGPPACAVRVSGTPTVKR